jgi:hypothetical protein
MTMWPRCLKHSTPHPSFIVSQVAEDEMAEDFAKAGVRTEAIPAHIEAAEYLVRFARIDPQRATDLVARGSTMFDLGVDDMPAFARYLVDVARTYAV